MSLLNAAANAAALMIPIQLILIPDDLFFQTKVYGFLALTVLVATRGSLAYGEQRAGSSTAATTSTAARTSEENSSGNGGGAGLGLGNANVVYLTIN